MNSFFRVAAAAAVVGGLSVTGSAPAQASQGHINGYEVAYLYDSGSYGGLDRIHIYGPKGLEKISVRCSPFNWDSYGANSSTFVDSIARSWCF